MTESDAEYYQEHKDDPEEWGDAEPTERRPSRRLASMISVRFSPEEEELIRARAAQRGTSVSNLIRQAVLRTPGMAPIVSVTILGGISTSGYVGPGSAVPLQTSMDFPQVTLTGVPG